MRHTTKALTLTAALFVIGCGSDDNNFNNGFFPNPTSSPVISAPLAIADSFTILGNSVLTGSVTANDTVNGATVTAFQNPSTSGGSVAITAAGQLTYTPPANASNINDTFTYTLSNSAGASTATVTVTVQARGFFVKNDAPAGGTGTQSNPFRTLADAVTAATGVNGAQIVVFRGDGTSTGLNTAATLSTNQGIRGQDPANPPLLTGPVLLTSGNLVQDVRFAGAAVDAVDGAGAINGTVTRVTTATTTGKSIDLGGATGNWTISQSTFANNGGPAIDATTPVGTVNITINGCTFSGSNIAGVLSLVTGAGNQALTANNCTFLPSAVGGGVSEFTLTGNTSGAYNVTLTNNTVTGGGIALRGIDILTQGTTQLTARILNNTISGCTNEGLFASIRDNSLAKMRFEGNRTTGNLANNGWLNASSGAATLQAVYRNNTSDRFNLNRGAGTTYQVEELANFNTISGNTGTLNANGGVQDVPAGSLGIP